MTRLKEDWIKNISSTIHEYEQELIRKTGRNLLLLASAASDTSLENIQTAQNTLKVGVIPITTGQGIIGTFSESVAAIVKCLGFEAFVTTATDVDGIYEAHQRGAKVLFMADDNRFIAVNLEKNMVADNSIATARGFVAAMEGVLSDLEGQEILVIGCGVVGREVLQTLKRKGAVPVAYDKEDRILENLHFEGFEVLPYISEAKNYRYIIDATSEGGWISPGMLHPEAWIVTPGVPLSLDEEAYEIHKYKLIHDFLPIGVAVMLAMVCA